MFFLLFIFFTLVISQYYENCELFSDDEKSCLNNVVSCGYCQITKTCINWDPCKNSPIKDKTNPSGICGDVTENSPYGEWIYPDNKPTCKTEKDKFFVGEIFFLACAGLFIIILFLSFILKLGGIARSIYKKYQTSEYQTSEYQTIL